MGLHWAKSGGWANIRGISIVFRCAIFIIRIAAAATINFSLKPYLSTIINQEQGRPAIGPILHHMSLMAGILSVHGYDR